MTSQLEKLCEKHNVRIEAKYGAVEVPEGWDCGTHPYRVRLRYGRRSLTTPFFQGAALTGEPTAADVLSCLLSDTLSYENAQGFADWCSEFGFDTDSRKAEQTWRQIKAQAPKVHRLLGEDFATFAGAEH